MMAPLCLAAPSGQPPRPRGRRDRRGGLTAKAGPSDNRQTMDASRVLCPAKRRYVKSESSWISCCCHHLLFNLAVPPIVATLELHLMRWISKGAPIEPMRHSPHQLISGRARAQTKVPHATLRGQKGLQGGWDPSLDGVLQPRPRAVTHPPW